jgi:hypothetical protein
MDVSMHDTIGVCMALVFILIIFTLMYEATAYTAVKGEDLEEWYRAEADFLKKHWTNYFFKFLVIVGLMLFIASFFT